MAERSQAHLSFGRAVRELRGLQAVSQEELAHAVGIHRTYLGGIERGERNPSYTNIRRLAHGLGVSVSELTGLAERFER